VGGIVRGAARKRDCEPERRATYADDEDSLRRI